MNLREFLSENFAGDLEYHPRRAAIYLLLGAASACFWFFSPAPSKFTVAPLVFILGALTLVTKGVFLLRKSSEGWGLTEAEWQALSDPANRKPLPGLSAQAAQIVQNFGAGSLLLWPLLNFSGDVEKSWTNPPRFKVFVAGAALFLLGWLIRKLSVR
jgi:hypothetical protein